MTQLLITGCSSKELKLNDFIGKEYRTLNEFEYFKDFKEIGGNIISLPDNDDYCFSTYKKDSLLLVTYEITTKRIEGKAIFKLLDILEIKGLKSNQNVNHSTCRKDGEYDPEIIVIYEVEEPSVEICKNILKAWKANRKTGRIEAIDITGLDCINQGFETAL